MQFQRFIETFIRIKTLTRFRKFDMASGAESIFTTIYFAEMSLRRRSSICWQSENTPIFVWEQ